MVAIALCIIAAFAIWWFQFYHIPHNFHGYFHIFDLLLFVAVSYVIWHPIVMHVLYWAIASNIKKTVEPAPLPGLRVAFLTTFVPSSESVSLLRKTLPAMINADYPHDTWLLDEGNDPEAQALCEQLGVYHFSRQGHDDYNTAEGKFARKTKGGNHNSWYDRVGYRYDVVAQIDTDFIAKPNFLTKTLGYFRDPKVAFVGTPQIYGNTGNFIARGAAQQTYSFYGPILRGLYGMGSTLLIGANHVIRVKALEQVDHYSPHITEDLLTGMKLHANGWKSIYVSEALAIGEGPSTWRAYFSQQMRWAYGCIDILFNHTPKLIRTMSWRQRIYYLLLQQHYFSGLATMVGVVCLCLYFDFGWLTTTVSLWSMVILYIPVLLTCGLIGRWLQRFNVRPREERGLYIAGSIINIACWPIFFVAFLTVLRRKHLTYKVTPKGRGKSQVGADARTVDLFLPHLLIGLACVAELGLGLFWHRSAPVMIFWMATTMFFLLGIPAGIKIVQLLVAIEHHLFTAARRLSGRLAHLSNTQPAKLPASPTDEEMYSYFGPRRRWAFIWIFVSAAGILYGYTEVEIKSAYTRPALLLLLVMVPPIVVNLWLRVRKPRISKAKHLQIANTWRHRQTSFATIDVFLPTCGEPIEVLRNSFKHIAKLDWPGRVKVYVLDDAAQFQVRQLANYFGFRYIVRPNRGELKKAGNLIHAFEHTDGDFIVVYDADFAPRADFLYETIPYMDEPTVGVVQTAQYFDINSNIGWIQRYAGTLQEVFFRWIQPARDVHEAAICAGTNVVYRRKAVDAAGGFARTPIGEDVHSGVKLWAANYKTRYVPIILAKGLAPDTFNALVNQQYRWCRSSMLIMINEFFRKAPFNLRQRLSFWAAFLYYMASAALVFTASLPTLSMLWLFPYAIHPGNYVPLLPAIFGTLFVFPLLARGWRPSIYRLCYINSFCHLFAISHALRGQVEAWVPTGAAKSSKGLPRRIGRTIRGWIVLVQLALISGLVRDVHAYGWHLYWPVAALDAVQLFILAPLFLRDYGTHPVRLTFIRSVRRSLFGVVNLSQLALARLLAVQHDEPRKIAIEIVSASE